MKRYLGSAMADIELEIDIDPPSLNEEPNWRIPEHYDYLNNASKPMWGWEFLRRNGKYQEKWHQAIAKHYDGKPLPPENEYPNFLAGDNEVYNRWCITNYINPKHKVPAKFDFGLSSLKFIAGQHHPLYQQSCDHKTFAESKELAVIIDLNLPVDSQLKAIKPFLFHYQKYLKILNKRPTSHITVWTKYLRVLDANSENALRKEAAPIIFGNIEYSLSRWDETLKQARNMVEHGFRDLLIGIPAIDDSI